MWTLFRIFQLFLFLNSMNRGSFTCASIRKIAHFCLPCTCPLWGTPKSQLRGRVLWVGSNLSCIDMTYKEVCF